MGEGGEGRRRALGALPLSVVLSSMQYDVVSVLLPLLLMLLLLLPTCRLMTRRVEEGSARCAMPGVLPVVGRCPCLAVCNDDG